MRSAAGAALFLLISLAAACTASDGTGGGGDDAGAGDATRDGAVGVDGPGGETGSDASTDALSGDDASDGGSGDATDGGGGDASDGGDVADASDAGDAGDAGGDAGNDAGPPPVCNPLWNGSYDLPASGVCSVEGLCEAQWTPVYDGFTRAFAVSNTEVWMSGVNLVAHYKSGVGWRGLTLTQGPSGELPIAGVSGTTSGSAPRSAGTAWRSRQRPIPGPQARSRCGSPHPTTAGR